MLDRTEHEISRLPHRGCPFENVANEDLGHTFVSCLLSDPTEIPFTTVDEIILLKQ